MRKLLFLLLVVLAGCMQPDSVNDPNSEIESAQAHFQSTPFEFVVDGNKLVGVIDRPTDRNPVATIIFVHGYGETNVVEGNWYHTFRSEFARLGINTLMWDKPGCGMSEGVFDINQPVESSAREVLAAIEALRGQEVVGSEVIGLWGISRAGWIAPLAIQQDPSIAFWISVSGTDANENGRYLLRSNWLIEGRSAEETEMLVSLWQRSFNTFWQNGSYQDYLESSQGLAGDDFMALMNWNGVLTEEEFSAYQARFTTGELTVDQDEELLIYVPGFREVLGTINLPVLALFGEKDTNVDWQKTIKLYQETIGSNPDASLTIRTFPDANHILKQSETGGVREMMGQPGDTPYTDGYIASMLSWLEDNQFGMSQDAD